MLLKGMGIISLIVTIIAGISLGVSKIYFLPLIWFGGFLALALLWCLFCTICTRFIDMKKDYDTHSPFFRYFVNNIIESLHIFLNIKIHVTGMESLPKEKFLLVGNHRGAMDPLLTMGVLRKYNMGFVSKKEVYKVPVISRLMHRCFCPKLDRGDIKEEAKTIIRASKLVKSGEASIGIYPEGKRNKTDEPLLPFLNGAFKIAKKANSDIVVAVIKNSELIFKNAPFKRTHVYLDFIGVIDKEFVATHNTAQISEKAREMIEAKLSE